MPTHIDVGRLAAVLSARIESENISWRQAASQIGVHPSLLSRLRNGQRPDLDAFVQITQWLKMSADDFLGSTVRTESEPELMSEVAALLRARKDLTETDKTLLENVFKSGLQVLRSTRPAN